MKCPTHLLVYVREIGDFAVVFPGKLDEYFVGYRLECKCGEKLFSLRKNTKPLVIGKCNSCGEEMVVLDADFHPAFSVDPKTGCLCDVIGPQGEKYFEVCIGFEYHELDEDEEFNPNDISWVYIYGIINDPTKAFEIINVEA